MTKFLTLTGFLFLALSSNQAADKKVELSFVEHDQPIKRYSKSVKDSFSIFISLPNDYDANKTFPVVYLLDANLYFDIMATTIRKYSEVGLSPSLIVVGIGYKDFQTMDSLRNRDYTYPIAIPEYEMELSGGAERFLAFISTELIPYIDKKYKTDTAHRILAGHSLGGYFSLFALLQNLSGKTKDFSAYIAASPSIAYNHYYLLNQFKEIGVQKSSGQKAKVYLTFGGLEDAEAAEDPGMMRLGKTTAQLSKYLSQKQADFLQYKGDIYSNLDHMDTPIPSFLKGLQWIQDETN